MHIMQMEIMLSESQNKRSIVKETHFRSVDKMPIICERLKAIVGDIQKNIYRC